MTENVRITERLRSKSEIQSGFIFVWKIFDVTGSCLWYLYCYNLTYNGNKTELFTVFRLFFSELVLSKNFLYSAWTSHPIWDWFQLFWSI